MGSAVGMHMSPPLEPLSHFPLKYFCLGNCRTEKPVGLVHGVASSDTTDTAYVHRVHITAVLLTSALSGALLASLGGSLSLFPLCFGTRLHCRLTVWKRGCLQRNVIKYTFAFCFVPLVPGKLTSPPQGRGAVILPSSVTFQGPSRLSLAPSIWSPRLPSHPLQVRERWFVCGGVQADTSPTDTHSEQVSALQLRDSLAPAWGNC